MAAVTSVAIGVATAGISAVQSFKAASDASTAADKADTAAALALSDAKKKAETDYFEGLNVPLDAYEAEFENNLAVSQQTTEALQEGDARQLAAGVGRVGAVAGAQAEKTRIAMGEQISDLNMMKAESKEGINQQLIEMDVANAREQNQRRADANALRAESINSGINSIGSGLESAAAGVSLYGKSNLNSEGGKSSLIKDQDFMFRDSVDGIYDPNTSKYKFS